MSDNHLPSVAYFSMEYGLHSDFKMYAGGLGILAGDYIKGAQDIGAPIIPIGLKWKQGYTDQKIDADGTPTTLTTIMCTTSWKIRASRSR